MKRAVADDQRRFGKDAGVSPAALAGRVALAGTTGSQGGSVSPDSGRDCRRHWRRREFIFL